MWQNGPVKAMGMTLLAVAAGLALLGVVLLLADRIPGLGKLPGDIRIEGRHGTFVFPVVTCMVASLILTAILNLVFRFFRR